MDIERFREKARLTDEEWNKASVKASGATDFRSAERKSILKAQLNKALSTKLNGHTLQELIEFYGKVKKGQVLAIVDLEGELPENPYEPPLDEIQEGWRDAVEVTQKKMLKANYKQVVDILGGEG